MQAYMFANWKYNRPQKDDTPERTVFQEFKAKVDLHFKLFNAGGGEFAGIPHYSSGGEVDIGILKARMKK
eukprot:11570635-Karenia_brevis.AAC.1